MNSFFERQSFALNGSVRIEYLEWSANGAELSTIPVLLLPGFLAAARDWAATPLLRSLLDGGFGRVAAVSLRGRGESDSPRDGWSLTDHLSDISAVLDNMDASAVHLVGHSVGASYALAYALNSPERVVSLVIGDFPPIIPPFDPDQVRSSAEQSGRQVTAEFVKGMERDTEFMNLAPRLGRVEVPVLIIRGTDSDVMEPMDLGLFDLLTDKTIVEVPSDHEVFAHQETATAVSAFLGQV